MSPTLFLFLVLHAFFHKCFCFFRTKFSNLSTMDQFLIIFANSYPLFNPSSLQLIVAVFLLSKSTAIAKVTSSQSIYQSSFQHQAKLTFLARRIFITRSPAEISQGIMLPDLVKSKVLQINLTVMTFIIQAKQCTVRNLKGY